MDSRTIKKLEALEVKAGLNNAGVFLIEDGRITSAGKEYTREEYEAIKKKKRIVTIYDDIEKRPDLSGLNVQELKELERYILKRDSGQALTGQEEAALAAIMNKTKQGGVEWLEK